MLSEIRRGLTVNRRPSPTGTADAFAVTPSNRSSERVVQKPAPRNSPSASTMPSPCTTRTLRSADASDALRSSISR